MKKIFDNKNQLAFTVLIIIPMFMLYRMIFFGEIVGANDELHRHPINQWRDNFIENNNEFPQWYPNLLSGMPSYGGYIYTPGDPTRPLQDAIFLNKGIKIWFFLVFGSLGMFFFLRSQLVSVYGSLIGGLLTGLTPYSFGLINAGHLDKLFSMAYIPWLFMCFFKMMDNPNKKTILLFSIVTSFQLWARHPQIVYYTWMVIGFYFCWDIGLSLKQNKFAWIYSGKKLGAIIAGLILSLLMVSDPYIEIFSFQKHSNRGAPSVLDTSGQTESGTLWTYATSWSFHPKETISFLYPYHYGLQSPSSANDLKTAAYWGFMRFTQSTHYLGLIAIILSILSVLIRKPDKMDLFFWVTSFLVLVTGFGSYFPILFEPFYSFFPFFSKFRVPSMIYVLLAVTIPFLAAKGFDKIIMEINQNSLFKKSLYISGGIAGISIIFLIIGETIFTFIKVGEPNYNPVVLSQIIAARVQLFNKGLLLALFISLSVLGLIWAVINKKISNDLFGIGIICLIIIDLWIVNLEFLKLNNPRNMNRYFQEDAIVKHLKADSSYFRIFPVESFSTNKFSYWNIESIGGYRPLKLRNYQDLIDATTELSGKTRLPFISNPQILNMLNVKYILTNKKINSSSFSLLPNFNSGIYENQDVLPKAWIVGKTISVNSQNESLEQTLLKGFNPSTTAIVVDYVGPILDQKVDGVVEIISHHENRISINCTSTTGGLMVLSEIYYKPGWKAFVNGQEVPIYQTNHVLRSINVPSGESSIIFEYDSKSWKQSRYLSRVSLCVILFILGMIYWRDSSEYNG